LASEPRRLPCPPGPGDRRLEFPPTGRCAWGGCARGRDFPMHPGRRVRRRRADLVPGEGDQDQDRRRRRARNGRHLPPQSAVPDDGCHRRTRPSGESVRRPPRDTPGGSCRRALGDDDVPVRRIGGWLPNGCLVHVARVRRLVLCGCPRRGRRALAALLGGASLRGAAITGAMQKGDPIRWAALRRCRIGEQSGTLANRLRSSMVPDVPK
jgi:hypothetical protein